MAEHEEPHPHPEAPKEVAKEFKHFQEVFNSGPHFYPEKLASNKSSSSPSSSPSSSESAADVAEDLHDLPRRFWQTASLTIGEREMEAINVSIGLNYEC
jgi:small subunit ribosomal protein YMR-31